MRTELVDAEARLKTLLEEMDSVLVAFSGGVDSALVLQVGFEVLGERTVAFTGVSPTFPPEEQATAREVTQRLGLRHIEVNSSELESEGYAGLVDADKRLAEELAGAIAAALRSLR